MALSAKKAVELTVSLIIMGVLVPRGLLYLIGAAYVNVTVGGHTVTWASLDPIINTMFIVILPLIIVIGLFAYFIPRFKK